MKCPDCGYNQKYSNGMRCGKCRRMFCLDPKIQKMSDGKFLAAVRRASYQGTVKFTQNQLYAAYAKRAMDPKGCFWFISVLLCIVAIILFFQGEAKFAMCLAIGSIVVFGLSFIFTPMCLTPNEFDSCVIKWKSDKKKIEGLIEFPSLYVSPEKWTEHDIYDYGVEQILIVDRDILVDLFVLNNRHAELRMLVVAESGYPDYISSQVNQLLSDRPDLPIRLLHDTSLSHSDMATRIAKLKWLNIVDHPVTDLGLMEADVFRLKQTNNFRRHYDKCLIPVDTLLLTPLCNGLTACFANESTFAEEIAKGASGGESTSASFG